MSKRRRQVDEEEVVEEQRRSTCTSLDHVYPDTTPGTRCYCGRREWKPLIPLDSILKVGDHIRIALDGPIYEVEMVNESRARCRLTTAQKVLSRRATDSMPDDVGAEEEDQRGRIINISPRSAVYRVSKAELEQETLSQVRSSKMASKFAGVPVAGKSNKQLNSERAARLAQKPKGEARPLTGAAAKAKANAKPKAEKSVRPCGCGCGGETTAYFVPGHDARFKGWLKRVGDGRMSLDDLQKAMGKKTFGKYTFKKVGAGHVTKTSYQEAAEA